jgi:hypothetical protein
LSRRLLVVLLGGLALIVPSAALAAPADVRLRVEGTTTTLLPRTALRTDTRTVNKDGVFGHDCTGTSAAGALEIGVAGDWSGSFFSGLGYSVERIRGESHAFPDNDFFELWVNNASSSLGLCGVELQDGDDVLFIVARCESSGPPDFLCVNAPVLPLALTAPAKVTPGVPFSVTVVEYAADGTSSPAAGATVGGGAAPAITNAAGVATVTLASGGPAALRATKSGRARSASEPVCATNGSDGFCGTAVPGAAGTPPIAPPPCATSGNDGLCGTLDRRAPAASISEIAEGRRFARGEGPRELRVVVGSDASGLLAVKLRLTRNDRGRCSTFSGRTERFRHIKCGASNGFWFGIGDRQDTSYLLPSRLPRGRYVLDVNAIDKAFNRDDARRRGGNRIVFHVG